MTAARVATVEPEAALELVGLVAGQLRRLIEETGTPTPTLPALIYLLAGGLEQISEQGRPLDAFQVELLRQSVWRGRRVDMAGAFNQLNPTFGVRVDGWCFPASTVSAGPPAQAAAQRRELELSMGERFASMLTPAWGGAVVSAAPSPQDWPLTWPLRVELGGRVAGAFDEENTGSRHRRATCVCIRAGRAVNRAAVAAEARRQGGAAR